MDQFGQFPPTAPPGSSTTGQSKNGQDSAILYLGDPDPFGQMPFVMPQQATTSSSSQSTSQQQSPQHQDGHAILDQVQKELQFLPTAETFVSGTISSGSGTVPQHPAKSTSSSGIPSGVMDPSAPDTDYLIGTDPISLGSPLSQASSAGGLGPEGPASTRIKYSIWQTEYYAQFFDLSTDIFFRRVLWSLLPLTGDNKGTYIERHISSNPDMFGPFWLALTLAFTVTICDNIVTYLGQFKPLEPLCLPNSTCIPPPSSHERSVVFHKPDLPDHLMPDYNHYHPLTFTFDHMHLSLLITFSYIFLAPLVLWSFCQWRQCSKLYSFLECLCAYGYSISVFIPAAILSLVDIRELQFIAFASAAFMSGSVLLISFAPVVHSDPNRSLKIAYIMLIFILVAHFILALFYLYIFL